MIWNIFSSKESTFAFCALSNLLLSNTHLRQLHAGQTLRQALQRIHLLNWLWKNANFFFRAHCFDLLYFCKTICIFCVFGLTDKFIINLMFFSFTYVTSFKHCIFVCTGLLTIDCLNSQCFCLICDLCTGNAFDTFDSLFADSLDIQFSFTSNTNDIAFSRSTRCSLIS